MIPATIEWLQGRSQVQNVQMPEKRLWIRLRLEREKGFKYRFDSPIRGS